jgi:hypothetical protein
MANESVRAGELDDDMVREWNQMRTLVNELKADHNALLAKLDADAGVTDTNYAATVAVEAPDVDSFSLNW